MKFIETKLPGAYLLKPEPIQDERGFFARTFCEQEFIAHGLVNRFVQCNISYNYEEGTLRGLHYQASPYPEVKIVRCTQGAIYDVIVDLRPDSDTYTQWLSVQLSVTNRKMLYIPAGFAHGFQTCQPESEVFYMMSEFYMAEHAHGIRWNDPQFAIQWPSEVSTISKRDRIFPNFVL